MARIILSFLCVLALFVSHTLINTAEAKVNKNDSAYKANNSFDQTNNHTKKPTISFGPFLAETQKTIKSNWQPPKSYTSQKVVVLFKVAKDGSLLTCDIKQSSGSADIDESAIQAIKKSAPFRPLPSEYDKKSVDIQFTFDINIINPQRKSALKN